MWACFFKHHWFIPCFIAEWYNMMWIHHNLLIWLPVDEHLHCFQFEAIMNKFIISIHIQGSLWSHIFIFFNKYLGIKFWHSIIWICLTLLEILYSVPKWFCHFTFLPSINKSFTCSVFTPIFAVVGLQIFSILIGVNW